MASLTILHAEDDKLIADAVRDECAERGWRVVTCYNGSCALNRLAGVEHFDLLITDNGLPDASGLEIVKYARRLPHRQHIPIIMYTASDCEAEAYEAGVDVFLAKPDEAHLVAATIARLLNTRAAGQLDGGRLA